MTYPIIERTYFDTQSEAWSFAKRIGQIREHWIVSDYGVEEKDGKTFFFIETMNDPFTPKAELLKRAKALIGGR